MLLIKPMDNAVIKTKELTRTFRKTGGGRFNAVDNLTLEVYRGEIFAFLGVNGAGKTTTMKMLLGLTFPSAGSFTILNGKITNKNIRAKIGYLPEESGLYPFLRVVDVLRFYARLFGKSRKWRRERVETVIDFTNLQDKRNEPMKHLSKGLRQRVGIAQALINDPDLIFLDEPASGLDPVAVQELRKLMADLKKTEKTVFLNSHQLSEVELVADRVGMINKGKLIKVGKLDDLLGFEGTIEIRMVNISQENTVKLIESYLNLDRELWDVFSTGNEVIVELANENYTDDVVSTLIGNGAKIGSVNKKSRTLEDLFSEIMRESEK